MDSEIQSKVVAAASGLAHVRAYDYQPGNGTRYVVIFTPLETLEDEKRSYGHSFATLQGWAVRSTLVTLWPGLCSCAMLVGAGSTLHPRYVGEKLSLGEIDAVAMTKFIGDVLHLEVVGCENSERASA